jgi:hypothetical protein
VASGLHFSLGNVDSLLEELLKRWNLCDSHLDIFSRFLSYPLA